MSASLSWAASLLLLSAGLAGAQAPDRTEPAPAAHPAAATPGGAATSASTQDATRTAAPADDLEPAVNTSDGAAGAPAARAPQRAGTTTAGSPGAATASAGPAAAKGAKSGKAMDRLELDATQITGNRELPKVLYIVPWKRSDLGDLVGKPANSLLDEVLEPVDRDVFKRENRYYRAVMPREGAPAAGAGDGSGGRSP